MTNPHIGALLREVTLPRPFSVNAMRKSFHRTNSEYSAWRIEAHTEIMAQGPRLLIAGPVFVDMIFPAAACSKNCDTDNQAKGCLDALVDMGLLADDNRSIVPAILLRWGPGKKTVVRIHEFLGDVL